MNSWKGHRLAVGILLALRTLFNKEFLFFCVSAIYCMITIRCNCREQNSNIITFKLGHLSKPLIYKNAQRVDITTRSCNKVILFFTLEIKRRKVVN